MSAVDLVIEEAVKKPAVVFSKTYCPYSKKAKEILTLEGAKYDAIEVDTRSDGDEIQAAVALLTGKATVPDVFIGGKFVGGADELVALETLGQLRPLLAAAGAL